MADQQNLHKMTSRLPLNESLQLMPVYRNLKFESNTYPLSNRLISVSSALVQSYVSPVS